MTRFAIVAALTVAGAAHADTPHDVARVRGLKVKKPIAQEIVDRADLQSHLLSKKTAAELEAEAIARTRWGLAAPVTNDDQVTGTYDPATKKLVLVTPVEEFVLVHEVEHALQDMHFDLSKVEGGTGDEAIARHALVEGDAIVTTLEVLLDRKGVDPPWDNPQVVAELIRAFDLPVDESYKAGFAFVVGLRAQKPWSAVDAAFKRPPRSTEQVLHVEKYLADEQPVAVETLVVADARIIHETTWGELGVQQFLRAHGIDPQTAKLAAAGWAGDRVTTLEKNGRVIGLARLVFDTPADAMEAFDAIERAIDDSQLAARAENSEARTRWLALDGTVSTLERRGEEITIELAIPLAQIGSALPSSR
ncbi:MAG TPA: hypothetical protein VMZ53_24510 [Kofleriaceae bacterium]|nr:hypothetical protein [Kofleriaceae bacterium]